MKHCKRGLFLALAVILLASAGAAIAADVTILREPTPLEVISEQPASPQVTGEKDVYGGTVRVYVVEPRSRWIDSNDMPFQNGFMDFALTKPISIPDAGVYENEFSWADTWGDLAGDNIAIQVVVFDDDYVQQDAYPPNGYYFNAYYVDAACETTPGKIGRNLVGDYTHTVFIEEGTSEYCGYCCATRAALERIHDSGNYNFIYAALVVSANGIAQSRMNNTYNYAGTPTCIFDGGYEVLVGGYSEDSYYTSRINTCGARTVPNLDLIAGLEWQDKGTLDIKIRIGNGVPANQPPPDVGITSGTTEGETEVEYTFMVCSTDPEGDIVYYQLDWGDGNQSDWLGPYGPGLCCPAPYQWDMAGVYDITARAVDSWGDTSSWSSPYQITIVESGCCVGETVGNMDNQPGIVDMGDLTRIIDLLFISLDPIDCIEEGDVDLSGQPEPEMTDIDMTDLTVLIDHLFISLDPLPPCP